MKFTKTALLISLLTLSITIVSAQEFPVDQSEFNAELEQIDDNNYVIEGGVNFE